MTAKDKKRKMIVRLIIAIILTVGLFALIFTLIKVDMPAGSADVVKILIGAIAGAFVTMISFYFGSSEDNDTLTKIEEDE